MIPARRQILALPLALAVTACASDGPEHAAPVLPSLPRLRRVMLVHAPSGERVQAVYFHSGRYDEAALREIAVLLRDRSTGEVAAIDPLLIDFLFDLISRTGLPQMTEVHVSSGYRSPQTNAQLVSRNAGAARESFHLQGKALDFKLPALPGAALAEIAKTMQRGGAAYYPSSGHTHIDTGPVRTWRTR